MHKFSFAYVADPVGYGPGSLITLDTIYDFDGEVEIIELHTTVTGIGRTAANEIVVLLSGYGPLVLRERD